MQELVINEITKSRDVFGEMLSDIKLQKQIISIAEKAIEVLNSGGKIMFCGNGGSAADSQHLAAELVSKLNYDRPGLAAIALTADTSALTAIGNDYGYEKSFARQVEAIGNKGDMLIGISTSGRSKNVVAAIAAAASKEIHTVGFLGRHGRDIGVMIDYALNIPSDETPKIQEGHICCGHIICALIENAIFGSEYDPALKMKKDPLIAEKMDEVLYA